MASFPAMVTDVVYMGTVGYGVTIAYADGTIIHTIVPNSLATIEAVTISAVALGILSDPDLAAAQTHHHRHRRYDPRTG
jgi:hypothetical protein